VHPAKPKNRAMLLDGILTAALLLATVPSAHGISGQKPSCVGSVQGQRFARLEPTGPETRIEASVTIAKKRYRMVALADTTGAARLYGLPEGTTSVRILPSGKAKTLKNSPTCTAPNDTGTLSGTFVSALTKVLKTERVAINVGTAVLVVPIGAFKSALVKISKGATSLDTANPTASGALVIDAGKASFLKPITAEFALTPGTPVTALFLPSGSTASVELQLSVTGPGTVELIKRPPTLTPIVDPTDRNFGEPELGKQTVLSVPTTKAEGFVVFERPIENTTKRNIFLADLSKIPSTSYYYIWPGAIQITSDNDSGQGAFSPDGQQIAFCSRRTGTTEIFLMNRDGSGVTQLTNKIGEGVCQPSWSLDNQTIFFSSELILQTETTVYAIRRDGTQFRRVSKAGLPAWQPNVSPDGKRIVFISGQTPAKPSVWLMSSDGSGEKRISTSEFAESDPVWVYAGQKITFRRDANNNGIFGDGGDQRVIMNPDGTDQTVFSDSGFPGLGGQIQQTYSQWSKGVLYVPAP
jgi:WD40-like Beta Propeller Repeat